MGTEGFSGAAEVQPGGQAQHTVPALILMGDWCALSRSHTTGTKCGAVAGRAVETGCGTTAEIRFRPY